MPVLLDVLDFFGTSFWLGVLIVLGGFAYMAFSVASARKKQQKEQSKKKEDNQSD